MSQVLDGLAIVVVNYGSHSLLSRNLVAVQNEAPEALVVVVDNFSGSPERDAVALLADKHRWSLVLPSGNLGFGAGVNAGVESAIASGADRYLFLNPDATIDRAGIATLDRLIREEPMTLAAPVIKDEFGAVWFDGADLCLEDGHMRRTSRRREHPGARVEPWLTGACLAVGRTLFDALGGFAEEYFLYWEDVELSVRARRLGARLVVAPDALAVHAEGGTHADRTDSPAKSDAYYYYNVRNRLVFAARNLDPEDIRQWLQTTRRETKAILLRGGRRQFLRPVGPLRAAIRGERDGRKAARAALAT